MHVGDRLNATSQMGTEYAKFLKRKFQGNPQDAAKMERYSNTSTMSYAEASQAPPSKLGQMNLHYSNFQKEYMAETNNQDRVSMTLIMKHLEQLEQEPV